MDTSESDEVLQYASCVVSRYLCTLYPRSTAKTSMSRNVSLVRDCLYSYMYKRDFVSAGSLSEGTMTTDSDNDNLLVFFPSVSVVQKHTEIIAGHGNVLILNKSNSNPGYTRLQYLEKNSYLEGFFEGKFLSSEKIVKFILDTEWAMGEKFERHGPSVSSATFDLFNYTENKKWGLKINNDTAIALVCNSWPDEAMEWFNRNRVHDWPCENIINRFRKEHCHVVAVGDPMSGDPSLEWRFSFLLAEKQLIWSFNDTQIHCYVIMKLLIQKSINPIVPDEITSYHLKTIVLWLSENLGISAWREGQLLQRVHDCLSDLSQCVRKRQLEHYFCRGNNLLKHKLMKPDDREFVLNSIESIKSTLVETVLKQISPLSSGMDENIINFLLNAKPTYYEHLKNAIGKSLEYAHGAFEVLCVVTQALCNDDLLQWALETFKKSPPADVDPIYIKHTLLSMDIRLAIYCYRASLNNYLSEDAKRKLTDKSLILMEKGVKIDNAVGKLYLATLLSSMNDFWHSDIYILQFLGGTITPSVEACKPDLEVIKTHDPDLVESLVQTTFPLVFLKEDVYFVSDPLKFECVTLIGDEPILLIHPNIYANTLFFMNALSMKHRVRAKTQLDNLAKQIYLERNLAIHHRWLNILGYCYSLDGQRDKAISCYINSLTATRKTPYAFKNAALYHVLILCYDIYTETRSD